MLHFIDGIVPGNLYIIDRIKLCPSHQHIQVPVCQTGIRVTIEDIAGCGVLDPAGNLVLVACHHVEVDTGDVSFNFVIRLKHCAGIATGLAFSQLTVIVVRRIRRGAYLRQGIGTATVVHVSVSRHNVGDITLHGRTFAKPALWNKMLAVVGVAFFAV